MKKEKGVQKSVMEGGERNVEEGFERKKKEQGGKRGRTNTWKGKRTNGEGDGFPSAYPLAKLAGVLVHDGCTRQGCCQNQSMCACGSYS